MSTEKKTDTMGKKRERKTSCVKRKKKKIGEGHNN